MPDDINTPPRTVVTTSNRAPRAIPERDADPARGLVPPSTRTPETGEGKELTAIRKSGAGSLFQARSCERPSANPSRSWTRAP